MNYKLLPIAFFSAVLSALVVTMIISTYYSLLGLSFQFFYHHTILWSFPLFIVCGVPCSYLIKAKSHRINVVLYGLAGYIILMLLAYFVWRWPTHLIFSLDIVFLALISASIFYGLLTFLRARLENSFLYQRYGLWITIFTLFIPIFFVSTSSTYLNREIIFYENIDEAIEHMEFEVKLPKALPRNCEPRWATIQEHPYGINIHFENNMGSSFLYSIIVDELILYEIYHWEEIRLGSTTGYLGTYDEQWTDLDGFIIVWSNGDKQYSLHSYQNSLAAREAIFEIAISLQ